MLLVLAGGARADDGQDLMYALGPWYDLEGGKLRIELYPDEKVWLNGKRWPTHDDDAAVTIQPGDVLITASPEEWHDPGKPSTLPAGDVFRYRLDRLVAKRAAFTLTTYDEVETTINSTTKEYSLGRRRVSTSFVLDLTKPNGLLVDYGPNHLEMGRGSPERSKPLR
ncbi:MAG TPA: hypothetical protein VHY09_06530 [Candidatus Methylacidiphilales bacterium]|nr:hypothetical protein [Candidatus Methylacidiphilales bacterium]